MYQELALNEFVPATGLGWGDFRFSVIFGGRNPFSGRVDGLSVSEPGEISTKEGKPGDELRGVFFLLSRE